MFSTRIGVWYISTKIGVWYMSATNKQSGRYHSLVPKGRHMIFACATTIYTGISRYHNGLSYEWQLLMRVLLDRVKNKELFLFLRGTILVQWKRCSLKGAHLFHTAIKWKPFPYHTIQVWVICSRSTTQFIYSTSEHKIYYYPIVFDIL